MGKQVAWVMYRLDKPAVTIVSSTDVMNGDITVKGQKVGRVSPAGDVVLADGNRIGYVVPNGDVYARGKEVGFVSSRGVLYVSGVPAGRVVWEGSTVPNGVSLLQAGGAALLIWSHFNVKPGS